MLVVSFLFSLLFGGSCFCFLTLCIACPVLRYRPTVPVSYIQSMLGFSSLEQCRLFLTAHNAKFTDSSCTVVDGKESATSLSTDVNQEGLAAANKETS